MKLENCELNIDRVVAAPMVGMKPEPDWVAARDGGLLPPACFTMRGVSGDITVG